MLTESDNGGIKLSEQAVSPGMQAKGSNYAWVVAIASFLAQVAAFFVVQLWGMNLAYMANDFGIVPTDLAIGSSLFGVIYAALAVVWGSIADKLGIRFVQTIGAIGSGIMLVIAGMFGMNSVTVIALYAIAGVFLSGISLSIVPKVVSVWFATHSRGKAFALICCGGSLAGVINGVIMPAMINEGGWRLCFVGIGIICVIVGVLVYIFVRNNPSIMGKEPFGIEKETEVVVNQSQIQKDIDKESNKERIIRVLKMPNLWKMGIIFILYQVYYMAHVTFFVTAFIDAGYDLTTAGLISSVLYAGIFAGQIIFPIISDHFARKNVLGILLLCAGILYMLLYFVLSANLDTGVVLVLMAACGVAFACNAMMQSTMTEMFPPDLRGTGPGMVNTLGMIGKFGGPLICGTAIASLGGSAIVFPLISGPCAIVAAIIALFTLPKTSGKYGDPLAEKYAQERPMEIEEQELTEEAIQES